MNRVGNDATSAPLNTYLLLNVDLKPCKLYDYDDLDDDDDDDNFSLARNCVNSSVDGTADEKDFLLRN
jgi:hypothetical protein